MPDLNTKDKVNIILAAAAQFKLGKLYQLGVGVDQDDAKAAEWFKRAMSKNSVNAKISIKDQDILAVVKQGDDYAQYLLDLKLKEQAKQGNGYAQYLLDLKEQAEKGDANALESEPTDDAPSLSL